MNGDTVVDVSAVLEFLPASVWPHPHGDAVITHLDKLRPRISELLKQGDALPLGGVMLKSPIANPGKIIGAPVNYKAHLEETNLDKDVMPGQTIHPIEDIGLFLKATSSLAGPGEGIEINFPNRRTDHEAEVVVVIGKQGRNLREEEALDHIAGYCLGLDMSLRGREDRGFRKSCDTYAVLGPWLTTAEHVPDPADIPFSLTVNGETRQKSNTRQLILSIAKLIVMASAYYTLYPGDVIMTGTPEGISPVMPGDVIAVESPLLGRFEASVRESVTSGPPY